MILVFEGYWPERFSCFPARLQVLQALQKPAKHLFIQVSCMNVEKHLNDASAELEDLLNIRETSKHVG